MLALTFTSLVICMTPRWLSSFVADCADLTPKTDQKTNQTRCGSHKGARTSTVGQRAFLNEYLIAIFP